MNQNNGNLSFDSTDSPKLYQLTKKTIFKTLSQARAGSS